MSIPAGVPGRRILAAVSMLFGLLLLGPGIELLILGGSWFYVLAGLALAISGFLLWREQLGGVWVMVGTTGATLAWSLWESGLEGWALLPRTWLFMVLTLVTLTLWRKRISNSLISLVIVTISAFCCIAAVPSDLRTPLLSRPVIASAANPAAADWPWVGGTEGAQRFSGLTQITPANVSELQVAWTTHLGVPRDGGVGVLEGTPIKVDDTIYLCNSSSVIMALDPETGNTRWQFDPINDTAGALFAVCRGVAYYRVPAATGTCSERIIAFARYARLFALDARSGKPCTDFGDQGEVSMLEGMGEVIKGYYYQSSAPMIVNGNVIVGGAVFDGQSLDEPSGVIRAYDAVTGKFVWAWDLGRSSAHGLPPEGSTYTRGTPNGWGPMTGDDELGLVYVPLGNATPDFLAAHRSAAMNKYSSSIVALDAKNGELRWSFQTVHRDVWDYDVSAAPTLLDFPTPTGPVPALIQATKTSQFFVLDRRNGKPLTDVVERAVPTDAVAGEEVAPRQPYSAGMPSFTRPLLESDMWGITPLDQLWCRIHFHEAHYEGDYTPLQVEPTIIYPGYLGGTNWYGVSVDPERQLLYVNVNHFAMLDRLIPRAEADRMNLQAMHAGKHPVDLPYWPQMGTPYAALTGGFLSPLQIPCLKPPYHELAAIDLKTRQAIWRRPLGTGRDLGPLGIPSMLPITMGVPAMGGTLLTRSGLLFIAATQDRTMRAFDSVSGKLLWENRLSAGGHANPMTYYSKQSGRQFVLIPASGHIALQSGSGDSLMAYALPRR